MINVRFAMCALLGMILWLFFPLLQTPLFACDQPPGFGFYLPYQLQVWVDGRRILVSAEVGTRLRAFLERDYDTTTQGERGDVERTTIAHTTYISKAEFIGMATPAYWTIGAKNGPCSAPNYPDPELIRDHLFRPSSEVGPFGAVCVEELVGTMSITPADYNYCSGLPIHITSPNFSGAYGNPLLESYLQYGDGYAIKMFSGVVSINGDNSIDWTPPRDAFIYDHGLYTIIVYNAQPGGAYDHVADGEDFGAYCYP